MSVSPSVELLAPAGNLTCLHAAVASGADAVYLGVDSFNARRNADNFTLDTLSDACDFAHLRGVKVYLTANTVILPGEAATALETMRQAYRAGVDAFIVQDVGLMAEIGRVMPDARIHVSTQQNIITSDGIRAAANAGAKRVTLGRECSLPEIAELCDEANTLGLEVETFAHGALCVCYSGQCFASSLVGGRSANRGMCAQVCRLPYELHDVARKAAMSTPGEHLLSPKDLCSIDLLAELAAAGVSSLKIEGRMKSPEYVASVVGVYRAVLDRVLADPTSAAPVRATDEEHRVLSEAFSRGFTTAYLRGESGNDIMSYGRPNNRGVAVGRVTRVADGLVTVSTDRPIVEGDVIEFWTNRGHFAHTVDEIESTGKDTIRLAVKHAVGKGDRVFRVRDASAAFVDDADAVRVPITASVALHIGRPARIELVAGKHSVTVEGSIVEAARTKALSVDDVREHVGRFGSSPFAATRIDVELDDGVGMGFSTLHHLRADACDALMADMLAPWKGRNLRAAAPCADRPPRRRGSVAVMAWATNPACARAAKKAGADAVYVPIIDYRRGDALVAGQISPTVEQAGYPNRCVPALPVAQHDPVPGTPEARQEFDTWGRVREGKPVYVETLGQLHRAVELGALPEVGYHLPATQPASLQALAEAGATRVWLSPELSLGQIQRLGDESPVPLGLFVSGAAEMMVTEHCILAAQGPCDGDCPHCSRRRSPHFLRDRRDFDLPVFTDPFGRSHLFNAVALDVVHMAPDLVAAGIDTFMVDTGWLGVEQTTDAVRRAVRARDLAASSKGGVSKAEGTTTGHLNRGVS